MVLQHCCFVLAQPPVVYLGNERISAQMHAFIMLLSLLSLFKMLKLIFAMALKWSPGHQPNILQT